MRERVLVKIILRIILTRQDFQWLNFVKDRRLLGKRASFGENVERKKWWKVRRTPRNYEGEGSNSRAKTKAAALTISILLSLPDPSRHWEKPWPTSGILTSHGWPIRIQSVYGLTIYTQWMHTGWFEKLLLFFPFKNSFWDHLEWSFWERSLMGRRFGNFGRVFFLFLFGSKVK